MNTLVLARTHRPRTFTEMVGQEHVVQALVNALTSQRLHHAYLFTGTRGVGKTTVSRILAKSLNCTGPDGHGGVTAAPCGVCPACTAIDAGRFVDYTELDAASNRGVDEISQLLEQSAYKPVVGRFKVFMIDEVHMLSTTAFNAMLKTLEEPPAYLKFVLATTDPQKVPVTVLSRCLQFNLRPMPPETVRAHLQHVLQAEAIPAEAGALRLLARAAQGSMRDGLSLTDQAIAFGAGTLTEAGVRQMLGVVERAHVFALIDALAAGDGAAVVATADVLRAEGLSAEGALEEMAAVLQQLAVLQVVPDAVDPLDAGTPDAAAVAERVALLPADELQLLYSIALHGRGELALAPDPYSGLVMVLLRMLAFRPQGAADARAPAAAKRPAAAPVPSAALDRASGAASLAVATARGGARVAGTAAGAATPAAAGPQVRPPASLASAPPQPAPPQPAQPQPAQPQPAQPQRVPAATPRPPQDAAADTASTAESPHDGRAEEPLAHRGRPADGPAATPPAADAAPADAVQATAAAALGDRWAARVRQLIDAGSVSALARELALQSECTALQDDADGPVRIGLRVERESLRNPAHAERLQAALAAALGRPVHLGITAGAVGDTPARREIAAREARQRAAEALIQNDPFVVQMKAQYPTARIVPGSIKPL